MKTIYLDYNASTPLSSRALQAMEPYLQGAFGNPSGMHREGRLARAGLDDSRDRLAHLLGVKPHELIFTAGGTESDNLAILGLARAHTDKGKHLVTSSIEHHAVLHAFEYLRDHEGFELTLLQADSSGRVDLNQAKESLRPDTILVSVMSANNETGIIQPIKELASLCRSRGILFHSDMIQSPGKQEVKPLDLGIDALSLAAHKFHGPKGAGLLYLRAGLPLQSLHYGGAHEGQHRPGTENVAAVAGMTEAAEETFSEIETEVFRQSQLRDQLWKIIHAAYPEIIRNGAVEYSLCNTLNISMPGGDGELLLMGLDLEGVCASSGSACMVGSIQPSHVLLAMGVAPELARATVRFSLGRETTSEEIVRAGEAFCRVWEKQRPHQHSI